MLSLVQSKTKSQNNPVLFISWSSQVLATSMDISVGKGDGCQAQRPQSEFETHMVRNQRENQFLQIGGTCSKVGGTHMHAHTTHTTASCVFRCPFQFGCSEQLPTAGNRGSHQRGCKQSSKKSVGRPNLLTWSAIVGKNEDWDLPCTKCHRVWNLLHPFPRGIPSYPGPTTSCECSTGVFHVSSEENSSSQTVSSLHPLPCRAKPTRYVFSLLNLRALQTQGSF